jgi:membrane-bound lytic murein transglycosylase D
MRATHQLLAGVILTLVMTGCGAQQFVTQLWPWKQDPPVGSTDLARPFPHLPGAADRAARNTESPDFDFDRHEVGRYVSRFQSDLRGFYGRALERSGRFVPFMSSILEREGVPADLVYLPLIESGFQTGAVSRAGAVGPWQFMRQTGRRYGLRIDRDVDERRDPIKSTEAAARYLRDLYDMFNDWHLSLAAYNTGEGNISRILERRGWQDYWSMGERGYLVRETREYVPRFLAALQIARSPESYGFDRPTEEHFSFDWVRVNRPLSLSTVAELCGTSASEIRELNPALTRGVVPYSGYTLRIPKGMKQSFMTAAANLPAARTVASARPRSSGRCSGMQDDGTYCLRAGETVGAIAQRYGVSSQALMKANGIRNPRRLVVGQALLIPGHKPTKVSAARETAARQGTSRTATLTHRVRGGETIGVIAKRYGMTASGLARANGIRNANKLHVGQILQIPGRAAPAPTQSKLAKAPEAKKPEKAVLRADSAPARVATRESERTAYTVPSITDPPRGSAARSHKVRKGETLGQIAARYGVSADSLMRANGIRNARRLQAGGSLVIPAAAGKSAKPAGKSADARIHTVRAGDTMYSIAKRYNVTVRALSSVNGIKNSRSIRVGQKLRIPQQVAAR